MRKLERLAGPATHVAWTPDTVDPERRKLVVVVLAKDLDELEAGYERLEEAGKHFGDQSGSKLQGPRGV